MWYNVYVGSGRQTVTNGNNRILSTPYPLLKWLPPRIEGVCYTQKENFMYFQVIATHNPQDFFCGQEPNELTLTFIVKEDALMETVKQCVCCGYIAIVYPYEVKGE